MFVQFRSSVIDISDGDGGDGDSSVIFSSRL